METPVSSLMKRALHTLAALSLLGVVSCAQKLSSSSRESSELANRDALSDASKALSLEWGKSASDGGELIPSGLGESRVRPISGSRRAYCFDNLEYSNASDNCKRAGDDVTEIVQNNPVAIQAFQLNFSRLEGQTVNLEAGHFTTAMPIIDTVSKKITFQEGSYKTWNFGTSLSADCNLSQENAVGYQSEEGKEKILTGIQIFDTATYYNSLSRWGDARLQAGRVWVSGFVPMPLTDKLFNFEFVPKSEADEVNFGYSSFVTSGNTSDLMVSPKFGLSEDTVGRPEGWLYHVIVGYCLRGTKTGGTQGTRPLVLRSEARVFDTVRLIDESGSSK